METLGAVVSGGGCALARAAFTAAAASTRPNPKDLSKPGDPRSTAVDSRRYSRSEGPKAGLADIISASTPAVIGLENEVPDTLLYPPPWTVVWIETPGAATST